MLVGGLEDGSVLKRYLEPMLGQAFSTNGRLRAHLSALICKDDPAGPEAELKVAGPWEAADRSVPIDVVVSSAEINDRHGTGPLVQRIFKGRRNIFSIRSRDDWGIHDLGDWSVTMSQEGRSRPEVFRATLRVLGGRKVRSVVCVPFLKDELLTSVAIKECFDARLCVYVMDDQNVAVENIPDELMREFLEKCSLRLATHPELRLAYESKYGLKFHLLPAVVPDHLIASEPVPVAVPGKSKSGALLGSFWDQTWFDRLCTVLEACDCRIDWYGNTKSPWLEFPPERLARARIASFGVLPEKELALKLRKYPFVIVPVGSLDGSESNKAVARLSLPGRILFAAATSHTPILVVGSERTCAARLIRHLQIGETVPYHAGSISAAMDRLMEPDKQREIRQNAARVARSFSDRGVVEWLAVSVDQGSPIDGRFEEPFAGYDARLDPV